MKRPCFLLLIAMFLWVSVLITASAAYAGEKKEITVSAAASLTNAFTEIGRDFELANPGVKVNLNFGASGALYRQIAQGAPVDVFAFADQETMDTAQRQGHVMPGSRRNFAGNSLVLIAPADSKLSMTSLKDLLGGGVRLIGMGNPDSVPNGRYAKEALERQGLWDAVSKKAVFGADVRQVLDYAARGEIDAGFVFSTDAMSRKGDVRILMEVPVERPILYPIALTSGCADRKTASGFIDYVMSQKGAEVLKKYGFKPVAGQN
ncbi:MAG: molybdate ABC transporter substrate-binding protein [Dissulfuribacterales bacterium]